MKFGVMFANVGPFGQAEGLTHLAQTAERVGFESLWTVEHVVVPKGYQSPYPYAQNGKMPGPEESPIPDPLVWLSYAAAVTKKIRLATGILILPQRHPVYVAKEVATLDQLSGGRVLFGVGGGWNKPEMENHGTAYATRFAKLEEQLRALKTIWSEDEAEFHGAHVDFDPLWCWPKPVTRPHPPIYLGGETDHTLRRIVRLADGWLPRVRDPELVLSGIGRLRAFAREAGRAEDSIAITAFAPPPKKDALTPFRDLGAERAILALPDGNADDTLRRLDRYAELLPELA
jgi:probable F420-dependent oxidoreductase